MSEKRTLALKSLLLTALASAVVLTSVRAQIERPREGLFDVRSASSAMVAGVHELEARLQLILSRQHRTGDVQKPPGRRQEWPQRVK